MAGHALVHWFETSIPIFLVVWLAEFDVGVATFGIVVALGYAPFGLGALPGGILADRYGPKRLVVSCLAGMSAAFLVLSLAASIYTIAVGLVLWGVAASVYHPAGLALISTGVSERGTVFAWHGIAGNAGIALGPFVAATLLIFLEWSLVAAILAVPGILAVIYGLSAEFDPTAAVEDASTPAPTRRYRCRNSSRTPGHCSRAPSRLSSPSSPSRDCTTAACSPTSPRSSTVSKRSAGSPFPPVSRESSRPITSTSGCWSSGWGDSTSAGS